MSTFAPRIRNRTGPPRLEYRSLSFALVRSPTFGQRSELPCFELVCRGNPVRPAVLLFATRVESQLNENQGSTFQGLVAGRQTLCIGPGRDLRLQWLVSVDDDATDQRFLACDPLFAAFSSQTKVVIMLTATCGKGEYVF